MNSTVDIQKQILELDGMLARLEESAKSQPKPSILAQIKALQKERGKLRVEFEAAAGKSVLGMLTPPPAPRSGISRKR